MPSGARFSTMSSYLRTSTVWLCAALMASKGVSTHGYSPIQPTIPRSMSRTSRYDREGTDSCTPRVLLATIRDGGLCPCPRCLVEKSKLDCLGLRRDMTTRLAKARRVFTDYVIWARNAIYRFAHPIGGKVVEMILKPYSAVPTVVSSTYDGLGDCTNTRWLQNAFSDKLGPQFNPSDMLVVDLMHEFELGVWKAIFTHLIRILYAADPHGKLVTELNERWVMHTSSLW